MNKFLKSFVVLGLVGIGAIAAFNARAADSSADIDQIVAVTAVVTINNEEPVMVTVMTRPGSPAKIDGSGLHFVITPSIETTGIKLEASIKRLNPPRGDIMNSRFLVRDRQTATMQQTDGTTGETVTIQVTPQIL